MDGDDQQQFADDMEDEIAEDDVLQIIEMDDNGTVPDVLDSLNVDEDGQSEEMPEEDMEEIPAEVTDMSDLVFSKHTDAVFSVSINPKTQDMAVTGGQDDKAYVWELATGNVLFECKDAVFSVSINPKTQDMAVTGGQDDKAYVWELATGNVLFECKGHKDSVTCTGFSHDGAYVATADLGGVVKVWRVQTKEEVFSFECSDSEWLSWHPAAHVLFLGTIDGEVWMWKIPGGECKTFSYGCTASSGLVLGDGKRACVGYNDGAVKIWDLKSGKVEHNIPNNQAHRSTVTSIDSQTDSSLVITGSTDVTAKLINTTNGKVVSTFDCKSGDNEENSVEAVGISPIQNFAATGTVEGLLCIWDINNQTCRLKCEHGSGIVGLRWDRLSPLVYTTCLDGVVRLWDARSGELASKWTGHTDSILGFDISSDSNVMVTVSEDNTARVFSLTSPDR